MAIIKAVNSRASIGNVIRYITKPGKTEERFIGTVNCRKNNILGDMRATKKSWGKTGGRQYKHFIQSFSLEENITPEEAHIIAEELVNGWDKFKGYEVCFATHTDRNHIHTHVVVNSVSFENRKKFNYSKRELQQFKDLSDRIIAEHGKEICRKNNEITASNIGAYKAIEKAAQGEYDSWLFNIVTAVISAKDKATSQSEFIFLLERQNIKTVWQDNRKYITFTDGKNHKVRNKKLAETFKINLDKEVLLNEFETNYTRTAAALRESIERSIRNRQIDDELEQRKQNSAQNQQAAVGENGTASKTNERPEYRTVEKRKRYSGPEK
ncbi:MAG: relaxase/mobilization nuclease domain-containing protein [Clostridiales bacterium]|nr:relaxase/mobilization nuclease domain-containing protein [Clostridiales bacterium]